MSDTEHFDPNTPPVWLMEHAKKDPAAMGWLVSGYLAGVEVGRKVKPCEARLRMADDGLRHIGVMCGLALGHLGAHSTVAPITWGGPPPAPPALPVDAATAPTSPGSGAEPQLPPS